jgi:glycosyltransferase involved in cell wall biosynthesis
MYRWIKSLQKKLDGLIYQAVLKLLRVSPNPLYRLLLTLQFGRTPTQESTPLRRALKRRLKAGPGPSIWFLPCLTWFSNGFQRPHQMARAFADIGCPIIYCEPPWRLGEKHVTEEGMRAREFFGVRDLDARLHLLRCPPSLLIEYMAQSLPDCLLLLWPFQANFIPRAASTMVIYEIIDDHALFSAGERDRTWERTHRRWLRDADVVVGTADDIMKQLLPVRPDALLLPNGVCIKDWAFTGCPPVPEDLQPIRKFSVVVGYYGAIAPWFDWALWEWLAQARRDWAFLLIGYPYHQSDLEEIAHRTRRHPNIFYLGAKPYASLPNYLHHFDVATIPFILNDITHACSPVKLFEYMAAGKPIVTTLMREILKYKSVLFAAGPEDFLSQLEKALLLRNDPAHRSLLKGEAEENAWTERAERLRSAIEAARSRQNNVPRRHLENA